MSTSQLLDDSTVRLTVHMQQSRTSRVRASPQATEDLIVLGSRGRGAMRSDMFGSTVNSVLDEAAIPVAVLRDEAIR
jgi:nucleotide-binding universal stress UspA family protein